MFHICRHTTKNASLSFSHYELGTSGSLPQGHPIFDLIHNGSLSKLFLDADILDMAGNVGISATLFDNPHYRQHLSLMGLRHETAFGCALDYLFEPSMVVQKQFRHEFEVMSSHAFKVAIQLRLGDSYTAGNASLHYRFANNKNAEAELSSVQHFFDCAEQLDQTFNIQRRDIVWFLVSDSLDIRRLAKEAWPGKILTQEVQPGHVAATSGQDQTLAMIQAAGEHWLVGMTDYQIVSVEGSLGKTGALRKNSWHTMYRLSTSNVPEPGEVVCDGVHTRALDYGQISQWAPFI